MEYTKIRLDFKYAEKGRFYRTVLVKSDIGLAALGEIFVNVLGGTMEHCFLYRSKDVSYLPNEWLEDSWGDEKEEAYEIHTLEDLSDNFSFEYDTGDGWDFACKKYKKKVNKDSDRLVFVLEGAGMGIWEDNIGSLYAYFSGEIDKDYNEEDEERGIYKPWNCYVDKYSEFDNPIDIDVLNDYVENYVDGKESKEKETREKIDIDEHKTFFIYHCEAIRNDGTKIERTFKMPAFWNYELLTVALVTTCDCPGIIKNILIENDGDKVIIDQYLNRRFFFGIAFAELIDPNMKITIKYRDGISTVFNCMKIDMETVDKKITRKTPILTFANGFNRLTSKEYYEEETPYSKIPNSYEELEKIHIGWIKNDITRLFTSYLTDYFDMY